MEDAGRLNAKDPQGLTEGRSSPCSNHMRNALHLLRSQTSPPLPFPGGG